MTLSWGDLAPTEGSLGAALEPMQRRLATLALAIARRPDLWRATVRHDPDLRWHCRLADLGDVEIWLLGWTDAQEVVLHDHGGSAGAFAVAEGELCEEYTERGVVGPLQSVFCPAGIARAFGPERIHHVTNRASAPATSIHVYSPPLTTMSFYELTPGDVPREVRVEHVLPEDEHEDQHEDGDGDLAGDTQDASSGYAEQGEDRR